MRLHLKISPAKSLVPFNYQQNLVGAFHKWAGMNSFHDGLSLYSLSWLSGGYGTKGGLNFENGATWFISSPEAELLKRIIAGIQDDPAIAFSMRVEEIIIQDTPGFSGYAKFFLASPVLIKRKIGEDVFHFSYNDDNVDELMTLTLKSKMVKAGLTDETIKVTFDKTYHKPKTTLVTYKGIQNKANFCPVILEGSPKAIAFAWDVGIGNSTGIGFGAIR